MQYFLLDTYFESRGKVDDLKTSTFRGVQLGDDDSSVANITLLRMRKIVHYDIKETIVFFVVQQEMAEHGIAIKTADNSLSSLRLHSSR
jgi:hypothetical protein